MMLQGLSPDVTATTVSIWVAIISSVISGLVGVLVTIVYSHAYEKRRMKLDVLRRFVANRYDVRGVEWIRAANEIFVVFQDSREVMQALADWHQFDNPSNWHDHILKLYKAMCRDARVKVVFNDSFFLKPFITKPTPPLIEEKLTNTPTSAQSDSEEVIKAGM